MRDTRARAVTDTSMTTHHDMPDRLSSSLLHIDVPTGHTQPARVTPPYTAQHVHVLLSRAACDEAGARAAVRANLCGFEMLDYHVYNFVSELRKLKKSRQLQGALGHAVHVMLYLHAGEDCGGAPPLVLPVHAMHPAQPHARRALRMARRARRARIRAHHPRRKRRRCGGALAGAETARPA